MLRVNVSESNQALFIGDTHKLVLFFVSSDSRRIINLSPVMVIPEEQPAQPALPIQPEGMRVVCGHCGNTFLVRTPTTLTDLTNHRGAHAALCRCAVVGTCILINWRAEPQPVLSYLVMGSREQLVVPYVRSICRLMTHFSCWSFTFVEMKLSIQLQIATDVSQAARMRFSARFLPSCGS